MWNLWEADTYPTLTSKKEVICAHSWSMTFWHVSYLWNCYASMPEFGKWDSYLEKGEPKKGKKQRPQTTHLCDHTSSLWGKRSYLVNPNH